MKSHASSGESLLEASLTSRLMDQKGTHDHHCIKGNLRGCQNRFVMISLTQSPFIVWGWALHLLEQNSVLLAKKEGGRMYYCICKLENFLQVWKQVETWRSRQGFPSWTAYSWVRAAGGFNTRHSCKESVVLLLCPSLVCSFTPLHTLLGSLCQQIFYMSFAPNLF